MKRVSRWRGIGFLTVSAFVIALVINQIGRPAMAQSDLNLGWEWRAKRALNQRVGLRVESIAKEKGKFFGLLNSPSLTGSLPDPMTIKATVIAVNKSGSASRQQSVSFRIPKMEMKDVVVGDLIAIGIIGDKAVCLVPPSKDVTEENIADWLPKVDCG